MTNSYWKAYWHKVGREIRSDHDFSHAASASHSELRFLSQEELIEFVDPKCDEMILDVGCGTGTNMAILSDRIRSLTGLDCTVEMVMHARERVVDTPANLIVADAVSLPLRDGLFDKVICTSVLQYLDDKDALTALREMMRVSKEGGVLVLHVKNLHSLYLATLRLAKRVKHAFGRNVKMEHIRSFNWYLRHLSILGADVVAFNSFTFFIVHGLPRRIVEILHKFELTFYKKWPLSSAFMRRHGAELKLKARVKKARPRLTGT